MTHIVPLFFIKHITIRVLGIQDEYFRPSNIHERKINITQEDVNEYYMK